MSSLIEGFEYDVFISYRQNDNRSGWVTEFVQQLQEELAATIKDPLSIYFDKNPHDGLLETHSVDKSLEGKLKCLVFIPIISQTYCDPKSFAWQYEFCAFNKLSREDQFGRDIKLSNRNVSSRILPIKIHDLDEDDRATIEKETGSVLRGIDFIFTSPGVSRPLRVNEDHPQDNTNKTFYRDQINKVARGIKELVQAMQRPAEARPDNPSKVSATSPSRKKNYSLAGAWVLVVALTGYGIYYFMNAGQPSETALDKSIAVLPFVDMSPEKNQEYLGDGLAEDIITALSEIKGLKVIGRTSSFQFKGEKVDLREVGQKLSVSTVLEGSVMRSGNTLRITAQLINVKDGTHIWSERFDRPSNDLFAVHDEISRKISEKMKITMLESPGAKREPTKNMEAYNAFVQGRFFYENTIDSSGNDKAAFFFREAIRLDSNFALPWAYLSMTYWRLSFTSNSPSFELAKNAATRAVQLDPSLSTAVVNVANVLESEFDLPGAYEKIQMALKLGPDDPYVLRNAAHIYTVRGRHRESVAFCKKALMNDPIQGSALAYLTMAYYYSGDFNHALETIKQYEMAWSDKSLTFLKYLSRLEGGGKINGEDIFPDKFFSFIERDTYQAISKFKSGRKTEAEVMCKEMARSYGDRAAYNIAIAYAYCDKKDDVLKWLEKSYENKEKIFVFFRVEPAFLRFQNEPRFQALVKKMNFPD